MYKMSEKISLINKSIKYNIKRSVAMEEKLNVGKEVIKHTSGIINSIKGIADSGLKSQEKAHNSIDKAIDIYVEQLKNPDLSEEEKEKLYDRIESLVKKATQKDTEYKSWVIAMLGVGLGGLTLVKNPEIGKNALKLLTKR